MSNHTQGKWEMLGISKYPDPQYIGVRFKDGTTKIICSVGWDAEEKANARLITAAPDLLNACRLALASISEDCTGQHYRARLTVAARRKDRELKTVLESDLGRLPQAYLSNSLNDITHCRTKSLSAVRDMRTRSQVCS